MSSRKRVPRWRVQAIERLIEEGDRRARCQGSGTGNQLALAGAQGAVLAALIDAHLIQQLLRIPHVESRAHMLCGAQVLGHGGTGEQDIGAGARNRHLRAIDAALCGQEPGHCAQERGLARAIGSDKPIHAGGELQVWHVQAGACS